MGWDVGWNGMKQGGLGFIGTWCNLQDLIVFDWIQADTIGLGRTSATYYAISNPDSVCVSCSD